MIFTVGVLRILRRRSAALSLAAPALASAVLAGPAAAAPPRDWVPPVSSAATAPAVLGPIEALGQDAAEYAQQHGVSAAEAVRRLRAQEESVGETDRIQAEFQDRLTGISVEHDPRFRIVVLLAGDASVADRTIRAGGMMVPVVFRTGASATRNDVVAAIRKYQAAIRARLVSAPGMGLDPATGELVVVIDRGDAEREGTDALAAELAELTAVPVRLRVLDEPGANMAVDGGARVEGVDPRDGRRYACTTGFVVTDGSQTGVVTAAHCPDALTYYDPDGTRTPLDFVGQWGVGYQDVQLHVSDEARRPLFYADSGKRTARTLTGARGRASTRGGEAICHRGEASGYSCSQVELIDYAPPGDLCAGPCDPVWITVAGPSCRGGDSGGPVFVGTTAFGIAKGGSYTRSGRCSFYFYMSTDYLPTGWSLLREGDVLPAAAAAAAAPAT